MTPLESKGKTDIKMERHFFCITGVLHYPKYPRTIFFSAIQKKKQTRKIPGHFAPSAAFRTVDLWFLSNLKEYDRSDSFPFDMNQTEFPLVNNQKENRHYDNVSLNLKGKQIDFCKCIIELKLKVWKGIIIIKRHNWDKKTII